MSISEVFGNIGNLFPTTTERQQALRDRKRRLERGVGNAILTLKEAAEQASAKRDEYYQQGKAKLAVGRNREARMLFQFARIQECHAANRMRQESLWSNALTQLKVAQSMQEAAMSFEGLVEASGLDVDAIDVGMDSLDDVEAVVGEINRLVMRHMDRDIAQFVADAGANGVGGAAVDDIMKQAEAEIAAENGLPISGVGDAASGRCL